MNPTDEVDDLLTRAGARWRAGPAVASRAPTWTTSSAAAAAPAAGFPPSPQRPSRRSPSPH